jgi:hypothetical protein
MMNLLADASTLLSSRPVFSDWAKADRELLRSRVFLRAVLPVLEVLVQERASLGWLYRVVTANVHLLIAGHPELGVALCFKRGHLTVRPSHEVGECTQRWVFKDPATCNAFFLSRSGLPCVEGGWRHPLLLVKTFRLLSSVGMLTPSARGLLPVPERAVWVRAMLYSVGRALVQLHKGGHAGMLSMVAESPERVYQWTVGDERRPDCIAMYIRMAHGKIQMGHGIYQGRCPFVHFAFRDVHAAFEMLTTSQSQMNGVMHGLLKTHGSPEYAHKMLRMMQRVDELIQG